MRINMILLTVTLLILPGCSLFRFSRHRTRTPSKYQQQHRRTTLLGHERKAIKPHLELLMALYHMSAWRGGRFGKSYRRRMHKRLAQHARALDSLGELRQKCRSILRPLTQTKPNFYSAPWRRAYIACRLIRGSKQLMVKYVRKTLNRKLSTETEKLMRLATRIRKGKRVYEADLRRALGWKLNRYTRSSYNFTQLTDGLVALGVANADRVVARLKTAKSQVRRAAKIAKSRIRSRILRISGKLKGYALRSTYAPKRFVRVGAEKRSWSFERSRIGIYKRRFRDILFVSRIPEARFCLERQVRIEQKYRGGLRWGHSQLSSVVGVRVVSCR